MSRRPVQLVLPKHAGWGGRRRGAGRKPRGDRAGVSHAKRPVLARRFPVHVTVRVLPSVWNLRSTRSFRVFSRALGGVAEKSSMHVCEFSVQGNHVHLIVEAEDARALSRGMQGFGVRMGRGLNRMMRRSGKVLADRFHAHVLRTPTEVARAVRYVRHNRFVHRTRWAERSAVKLCADSEKRAQPDPYSSAAINHGVPLSRARTWLLSTRQRE